MYGTIHCPPVHPQSRSNGDHLGDPEGAPHPVWAEEMAQEKGGHGGFHTAHRLKELLKRKLQHDNYREGEGDAGHGEEQSVKGGQRHGQGHRGQKGAKNAPILGSA